MADLHIHEAFTYLRINGAAQAIAFYSQAFGAVEKFRLTEPSGRIGHAELQLGPTLLMLSEAFPEHGLLAPDGSNTLGASVHLHVDDCDAWVARAVAAGATLEMAPTDQFYGERSARSCARSCSLSCNSRHITLPDPLLGRLSTNSTMRGTL